MGVVERIGPNELEFGGRFAVRTPGRVRALEDLGDVVAVLIEWIDGAVGRSTRRVHGNNLYGYRPDGTLLWRVAPPAGIARPLLLTGFLEDAPGLRLHEAHGWWVTVDRGSGGVLEMQWIA